MIMVEEKKNTVPSILNYVGCDMRNFSCNKQNGE